MPKTLLALSAFAVLLLITTEALANFQIEGRNPVIYNPGGDEVGVPKRFAPDGLAVMLPSSKT
jgi:hypothetical protein